MDDKAFAARTPALLVERWGAHLDDGERFEARGSRGPDVAAVELAVVGASGGDRHQFEVKVPVAGRTAAQAFDLAVDAADALLGQWLEAGRPRLPGATEEASFQGVTVEVTARLVRPALDAEADRLLGEDG